MTIKKIASFIWYALPVQLFLLHFRKHIELLIIWYILLATITGHFLSNFGADSLFLAPEYMGEVNFLSTTIVGFALGIFLMSWNIATFILHSRSVRFLVTTAQPFLKYCINNALLPLIFLVIYLVKIGQYANNSNLFATAHTFWMILGLVCGCALSIAISFIYFFGADKTIYKNLSVSIRTTNQQYSKVPEKSLLHLEKPLIPVKWFFSAKLGWRKPRDVRHYPAAFIETVLQRHHFSAVIAIFIAFIFLVAVGFISDTRLFQLPAAASIILFFSLLIAFAAALTIFLKTWTIPVLVLLFFLIQGLYQYDVLNIRNKAYGLNYSVEKEWPQYTKESIVGMTDSAAVNQDRQVYLQRLKKWKDRQKDEKPVLFIINTSGGGSRSATFTFHILRQLDSITSGNLLRQTFLITGASGGMLGAAFYRELYLRKLNGSIPAISDTPYTNCISKDLLSPLFSSFITRDIMGPVQHFTYQQKKYPKDRGYAFEQKLSNNTLGLMDKPMQQYAEAEAGAIIPTLWMHAVITQDGRKLLISNDRLRFLMRYRSDSNQITPTEPDAVDFQTLFQHQDATALSFLTALRMNATFPIVLPNVWLPTQPVIDVMDAGLRDNFGQESALRFVQEFSDWLQQNTSGVVIIQIRDRSLNDWEVMNGKGNAGNMLTDPIFALNKNWYRMQDFAQQSSLHFMADAFGPGLKRISFQYVPTSKEAAVGLSFHLTEVEKRNLAEAVHGEVNVNQFRKVTEWLHLKK
ncbi:MAG: hypothetical protein EBX50_01160 [Chitinophagia bacterium]|nr:hypothetical protein [Chitinophagia bacterium]